MEIENTTVAQQIARQLRAPLPGLHPVLTWQMNLTVHKATGLAKFVSVLREPNDREELHRQFRELDDWSAVHLVAIEAAELAVFDMGMLMGFPTAVYSR